MKTGAEPLTSLRRTATRSVAGPRRRLFHRRSDREIFVEPRPHQVPHPRIALAEHEMVGVADEVQLARLPSAFEQLDRLVELQLPRRKEASAIRNRHMVDLSEIVFGFWSTKGGGTVKALKYALRKRKEVHAIPVTMKVDEIEDY